MAWFKKQKKRLTSEDRRDLPRDVFEKCGGCGEILYRERLVRNLGVCPECGNHFRISAGRYIEILADQESFEELDAGMESGDPLGFTDLKAYGDRLQSARRRTGRNEAVITGRARIEGIPVVLAVMDFGFIGGSMGSVVGEKIARAGREALDHEIPLIVVSASGGARMMEGIFSLMQMAKTSGRAGPAARAGASVHIGHDRPDDGGGHRVLCDAGRREPRRTRRSDRVCRAARDRRDDQQELPPGFQSAEFLEEHGMVDRVIDRRELKGAIAQLLRHSREGWRPWG